jgi:tRNA dimethylallyltransferase
MASKIVIVCGPTASGKSALALDVAGKRNGVIINADSQQMYRELRILTARPTEEEELRAPHRLYGAMSAAESCSAGRWLTFAKMEIDWVLAEGKLPIVTGGTGLYLKALLEGIAEIPEIDPMIRAQAASDYESMGKEAFAERLKAADPEFFTRLKVYDRQRLLRAYEVWLGTGKSLSWWQKRSVAPPYARESFEVIKVEVPREELYRRCDGRFLKMVEEGALEEVKQLLALKLSPELPAASCHEVGRCAGTCGTISRRAFLRCSYCTSPASHAELCQAPDDVVQESTKQLKFVGILKYCLSHNLHTPLRGLLLN